MMKYTEYNDAQSFLNVVGSDLEKHEAVNGLMLGVCLQLKENINVYGSQPFLATIERNDELRLAALMTPPHKLQIYMPNDSKTESIKLLASKLRDGGWSVPAVLSTKETAKEFAAQWQNLTGISNRIGMKQRIYELRKLNTVEIPGGRFREATTKDLNLAKQWIPAFTIECLDKPESRDIEKTASEIIQKRSLFLWEDNVPVSMAAKTRPTPNGESINYVYTLPEYRRRGYGTAVVWHLTKRVFEAGKEFCTLYTDLSNPTSNSIYQKIGYQPVADVLDINFENQQNH